MEDNLSYNDSPIPEERDERIRELIRQWISDKEVLSLKASDEQYIMLIVFSDRLATLAVRNKDRQSLIYGLLALAASWDIDCRDSISSLAIYIDAATRIDGDFAEIFAEIRHILPAEHQRFLDGVDAFLRRAPEHRSMKYMGYTSTSDADGFRYANTWRFRH